MAAAYIKPEHDAGMAHPWPSVKQPTVRTDRPGGPDAVRYASVDTATHRPAVTHTDTQRDEKETARRARFRSQRAVSQVVAVRYLGRNDTVVTFLSLSPPSPTPEPVNLASASMLPLNPCPANWIAATTLPDSVITELPEIV
jgi:hypothetical protein